MKTAWANLTNARRIDRILDHVEKHRNLWRATRDDAWLTAHSEAMAAARKLSRFNAWSAAMNAFTLDTARGMSWEAVWGACAALIAWDDCGYILDMPADAVRLLAGVGNPAAVLLLPAVLAMNGDAHELLPVQLDRTDQNIEGTQK